MIERIDRTYSYQGAKVDFDRIVADATVFPAGSTFHIIPGGERFVFTGGNWEVDISGPISEPVFNAAHSVARRIAEDDSPEKKFEFYPDSGHYNFIERR